jgi:hypothetical protein
MMQPHGIVLAVKTDGTITRYLLDDESGLFFATTLARHYKLFHFDGSGGSPISEPLKPSCES